VFATSTPATHEQEAYINRQDGVTGAITSPPTWTGRAGTDIPARRQSGGCGSSTSSWDRGRRGPDPRRVPPPPHRRHSGQAGGRGIKEKGDLRRGHVRGSAPSANESRRHPRTRAGRGRSGRQGATPAIQVLPVAEDGPEAHLGLRQSSTRCCSGAGLKGRTRRIGPFPGSQRALEGRAQQGGGGGGGKKKKKKKKKKKNTKKTIFCLLFLGGPRGPRKLDIPSRNLAQSCGQNVMERQRQGHLQASGRLGWKDDTGAEIVTRQLRHSRFEGTLVAKATGRNAYPEKATGTPRA